MGKKLAAAVVAMCCINHAVAQDSRLCFIADVPPASVIPACNSIIAADPNHAQAYQSRGYALYQMGQYDRAIADYSMSLAIDQKYIRAYYYRGLAWEAEGRLQNALKDFRTIVNLDPSFQDAQRALARVNRQLTQQAGISAPKNMAPSGHSGEELITMEQDGGVFVVPVRFNDVITLNAIVDSGAAHVSVPNDIVLTLIRTKTITAEDFLGQQTYVLADGSKVPSQMFRIKSLTRLIRERAHERLASVV